jgi:hypothetical protein
MKSLVIAAKKREGKWQGALIADGDLQQVSEEMNVAEFTAVAIEAALGDEAQVTITINIGQQTEQPRR